EAIPREPARWYAPDENSQGRFWKRKEAVEAEGNRSRPSRRNPESALEEGRYGLRSSAEGLRGPPSQEDVPRSPPLRSCSEAQRKPAQYHRCVFAGGSQDQ